LWSAEKEALYQDCLTAADGDAAAMARVMGRKDPTGVTVGDFCRSDGIEPIMFCARVISERARTIEVWKQIEGAA
jgi:hypothetical protein